MRLIIQFDGKKTCKTSAATKTRGSVKTFCKKPCRKKAPSPAPLGKSCLQRIGVGVLNTPESSAWLNRQSKWPSFVAISYSLLGKQKISRLQLGDQVKIADDPMRGLAAVILHERNDRDRVAVLLSTLEFSAQLVLRRSQFVPAESTKFYVSPMMRQHQALAS